MKVKISGDTPLERLSVGSISTEIATRARA